VASSGGDETPVEAEPRVAPTLSFREAESGWEAEVDGEWVAVRWGAAELQGPPPLEVDGELQGWFPHEQVVFRITSEHGDGLCPGAPTTVALEHGAQATEVVIEAPVVRELGHGPRGAAQIGEETYVLFGWGRSGRRIVRLDGAVAYEGEARDVLPDCDCCE